MRSMTNYTGTDVSGHAGAAVTERSGTSSADTVEAGTLVVWRNTGAGTHVVTITTNNTEDDLAVGDQTISIAAGTTKVGRVKKKWGDVDGRCAVAIDGTASEVKYSLFSGV